MTIVLPRLDHTQVARLDWWLQRVLWDAVLPPANSQVTSEIHDDFRVHRLKGRIVLDSGAVKMVQGVRETFEISDVHEGKDEEKKSTGKLVIIGRHISHLPWRHSLEGCLG